MSNEILTISGIRFNPFQASYSDIQIEDIAHALSFMTRANGHIRSFYSIAQHSINCCLEARARGYSQRVQLACLLHDASESYLSDLTRPVKKQLGGYAVVERALQDLIFAKFGLPDLNTEEKKQVKTIDDALLHHEFAVLRGIQFFTEPPKVERDHDFSQRDFAGVEMEYLKLFQDLELVRPAWQAIGVDGCKTGWVSVHLSDQLVDISWSQTFSEVWSRASSADCLLVDMPIGLPSGPQDKRPEPVARRLLPGRSATLFSVPCRQVLAAGDYASAQTINREILGRGLSRQSFALIPAIREVDLFLMNQLEEESRNKIRESHPELCFAYLNRKEQFLKPLPSKHTPEGRHERIKLLQAHESRTSTLIQQAQKHPRLKALMTDVLDALVLAVCGRLGLHFGFMSIPENPALDQKGLPMQISLPHSVHKEFTQHLLNIHKDV